jgi:proteasome assembly chaperone (PAC2) family protein
VTVLVAAFAGWNDAADAATEALEHLAEVGDALLVTTLDCEDFYDFQFNRPYVVGAGEEGRELVWPQVTVRRAKVGSTGADILLVQGDEPNMRWRSFCEEILRIARAESVTSVIALGSMLADAPHTRPVPIHGSTTDSGLAQRCGYRPPTYEGPTGITGVFTHLAAASGLPTTSLWAAVPHYVSQSPCPKAVLALLHAMEDVLGIAIPLGEFPDEARAWQRGCDDLAADDPDIAEYVTTLEEQVDSEDLPAVSGEAIAAEFERYLRRRADGM